MTIPNDLRSWQVHEMREELLAEARELVTRGGDLTGEPATRFAEIEADLGELANREQGFTDERARLAEMVRSGRGRLEHGFNGGAPQVMRRTDPWESPARETATETRSRALTAIERWTADDSLKGSATATVERLSRGHMAGVAGHVIRFSHPLYCSAFRKYTEDPETYAASLTAEERAVWAEAREHQRATLQTSGAVLPSPLDPAIVLTNDGDIDPMRSVARVDTTAAKEKRYITSAGSSFSFDAEASEVSDDTFTEAEVTITTAKGQGFIQASLEAWADQPNFSEEVARIIADGKARLEASKFVTGTGTNEPKGIEVALNATTSEVNSTSEALTADDVYALLEDLPPRFRQNALWQLELSTLNTLHRLWNPSGTEPPLLEGNTLLKRPYVENSAIDPASAINAAATASNRVLFVGDWRNYVILDRVGLSVAFVGPGILQNTANNRPDGRVGWYAYWRTGADVLTVEAFRMLDVATTA